ncbi:SpoIIAA family protein [Mycolicibacterium palauense]|uniref:STAS/SEC14 domain-containing protein n=1 Tax=Mycolicibacterium palauense TaxID=2034511 RepID=UPI000BFEE9BD|nr:STAS/SEC14 domain-containing protein [Mycolicibacterium palauense]
MIETLPDMPAGVIGLRAVGRIEPEDYTEIMDPAVDRLLAEQDKINMVYVVGDDFDRYSLGAMWEDAKFGLRDPRQWGRIAMVTNHDWLKHAMAIFGPITPGHCRVFPVDQVDSAAAWAGGQG